MAGVLREGLVDHRVAPKSAVIASIVCSISVSEPSPNSKGAVTHVEQLLSIPAGPVGAAGVAQPFVASAHAART